jgi:hypothetical protein
MKKGIIIMQDTYYVQLQARRMLKRLHKRNYENININAKYLNGMDEAQFWEAFGELHDIYEHFYTQVVKSPTELSLPLYNIADKIGSKEIITGLHPLLDFPITLLAMGAASVLENNTLIVNIDEFRSIFKELRPKSYTKPINWLADNGFIFTEWNGKSFNPKSKTFVLDYPDNPNMLVVLSAMGARLKLHMQSKPFNKNTRRAHNAWGLSQFVYLAPHIYANEAAELPSVTLNHLLDIAGKPYSSLIKEITDRFIQRGFGIQNYIDHENISCVVCDMKNKDTLNRITLYDSKNNDGEKRFVLRLKLNHPGKYTDKIDTLPPHLKERFENVWCHNCAEKCNRKIKYRLNGDDKTACGCDVFNFNYPTVKDVDILMELFDVEQSVRITKK